MNKFANNLERIFYILGYFLFKINLKRIKNLSKKHISDIVWQKAKKLKNVPYANKMIVVQTRKDVEKWRNFFKNQLIY